MTNPYSIGFYQILDFAMPKVNKYYDPEYDISNMEKKDIINIAFIMLKDYKPNSREAAFIIIGLSYYFINEDYRKLMKEIGAESVC